MNYEIIDFHTHPFIHTENNFCHYKENMNMDYKTTLEDMESAGISMFCGSVIKQGMDEGFETLKKCNREALKLRDIYGEKYMPGFHVHPDYVNESIEEIEFAVKNNVKLIGEIVPYTNCWKDYSRKEFSEILDVIAKHNLIVSVHTMDFESMEKMVASHKDVTFVFAHPGEKTNVQKHIDIMKKFDNVHLDLSGTGLFRYGLVRHLVDNIGAERILFGTDYPICNLQLYVNGVLGEKLSDKEKELIFSGNAKRLLFDKK